jgi:hypothetical protein
MFIVYVASLYEACTIVKVQCQIYMYEYRSNTHLNILQIMSLCGDIVPACQCASSSRVITKMPPSKVIHATGPCTLIIAINTRGRVQTLNINMDDTSVPGSSITIINVSPTTLTVYANLYPSPYPVANQLSATFYFISKSLGWVYTNVQLMNLTTLLYKTPGDTPCDGVNIVPGALYLILSNPTWDILDNSILKAISFNQVGKFEAIFLRSTIVSSYPPFIDIPIPMPLYFWGNKDSYTPLNTFLTQSPIGPSSPWCLPTIENGVGSYVDLAFEMPDLTIRNMSGWVTAQEGGGSTQMLTIVLVSDSDIYGPIYGNLQVDSLETYTTNEVLVNNYTITSFLSNAQIIAIDFLLFCGNGLCTLKYSSYITTTQAYCINVRGDSNLSSISTIIAGTGDGTFTTTGTKAPMPGANVVNYEPAITNVTYDTDSTNPFPLNLILGYPSMIAEVGAFCNQFTRGSLSYNPEAPSQQYYGYFTTNFTICIPCVDFCSSPPTPSPVSYASATYTSETSVTFVNATNTSGGTWYNDSITVENYIRAQYVYIVLTTVPGGTDALLFSCSWQQAPQINLVPTIPFSLNIDVTSPSIPPNVDAAILWTAENGLLIKSKPSSLTNAEITLTARSDAYNMILNNISFATVTVDGDHTPVTTSPNPMFTVQSITFLNNQPT